ncbi:MAG TPA: hypothetical protein VFE53_15430 [Mucilaginibacter sp.]|jgi:hypothetical protein|nr:hypothetical protein [Mucilaginibacter sp.]
MKLFKIFRKKTQKPLDLSSEKQLRYLIDYIPDFYKNQRQYINAGMFLDHHEWVLALESLIELADEIGHYFSEEFWERLASAAKTLDLVELSDYCLKQIKRNEQDLKFKTPYGWTTIKIDETHFKHHISDKLKEKWATDRRKKDKIKDLMGTNGVHLKSDGRSGFIYIVEEKKLAEVDFELGTKALIIYFSRLSNWVLPDKLILKPEEKLKIRNDIEGWAVKTNNAIDFDE